jgi:hypothetical protein
VTSRLVTFYPSRDVSQVCSQAVFIAEFELASSPGRRTPTLQSTLLRQPHRPLPLQWHRVRPQDRSGYATYLRSCRHECRCHSSTTKYEIFGSDKLRVRLALPPPLR